MWKNCPPRYEHGVKREVKVNLVYPKYDHQVIQRIRKMHDDCSVFVNEKGLNVVSISSVETFGGQGETFRAAVELYPHCVYQRHQPPMLWTSWWEKVKRTGCTVKRRWPCFGVNN
ncbi:hypothetical protein Bca52824_057626 [Brassica carinata]|uniref:Uncharacterized protein n=1 Tax=Brassica carinata TaxID=52824 RepID=A0A8X7UEY7_BRACI|nr:hypothetical protein Bca52824_057626 [Brassica carinata]